MLKLPTIQGIIDRRMLVNFRVDPTILQALLPRPFRPKLHNSYGVAGICLIRFKGLRPLFLPPFLGHTSENAAHRIAVEWEDDAGLHEGVYIPRRDTSSRVSSLLGGKLFPGRLQHASFDVAEANGHYRLDIQSDDQKIKIGVEGYIADQLPETSIFKNLDKASAFFQAGAKGFSPGDNDRPLEGMELETFHWSVRPVSLTRVASSFFDDAAIFPKGSIAYDNTLLMTNIDHRWHAIDSACLKSC